MTNAHGRLKIGNTPAQAYINHQGGTKSVCLCSQAQELWKWCLLHQTIVSAEHLPGVHMKLGCRPSVTHFPRLHRVDDKSTSPQRNIIITSSKTINRPVCFWSEQTVFQSFAVAVHSCNLPDAWKIDAFSFPWIQKGLCAFLPFCLVGKVLAKVIQNKSQNLVLVTPWWPSQP